MKLKLLAFVFAIFALSVVPVRADSFAVDISATFATPIFSFDPATGYSQTTSSETFSSTFTWDSTLGQVVPSSLVINSTGSLTPFVMTFASNLLVDFQNASGDTIELNFLNNALPHTPVGMNVPGDYPNGDLSLRCKTCFSNAPPPFRGTILFPGPGAVIEVVQTPEPSAAALLGFAILVAFLSKKAVGSQRRPVRNEN